MSSVGQPPSVEFCMTHKVKLTSPQLKQAHMGPDCMTYTPPGIENFDSSPVEIISPLATESIGDNTSYEEMVYPAPQGSVMKPTVKKEAGEAI